MVLTSVVNPDPHESTLVLVGWIRIRIRNAYPNPDPGEQNIVCEEISCFQVLDAFLRGETFPVACTYVFHGGLEINKLQFSKKKDFFQL